jgi:hypothetical protein
MQRLPLTEAAKVLGITREAARKRVQRGTLHGWKENGCWIIELDDTADAVEDDQGGQVAEIVGVLRDENKRLWDELQRKDSIIMALTQKIQALPEPTLKNTNHPWWKFWL